MPLLKRRTTREATIPTSSMADIAFLLLIFFLVTTTINAEKGIYVQLPPRLDDRQEPPEIKERNLLQFLVNSDGTVLIDNEFAEIDQIGDEVKRHVLNEGRLPNYSVEPERAVVSFKAQSGLEYARYIEVLDEIKLAYNELWNDYSEQEFGRPYSEYVARLEEGAEDLVREKYPQKLSLAEPDPSGGTASLGSAAPADG